MKQWTLFTKIVLAWAVLSWSAFATTLATGWHAPIALVAPLAISVALCVPFVAITIALENS